MLLTVSELRNCIKKMTTQAPNEDLTGEALLSLGDASFVDENYEDAVDAYAAAASVLRESEALLRFRVLSHRSAAFFKLQRFEEALEDAEQGLAVLSTGKPSGLRSREGEVCHRRAGFAAFKLNRYPEARDALGRAAQLAALNERGPGTEQFYAEWIQRCEAKLHRSTAAAAAGEGGGGGPPKVTAAAATKAAPSTEPPPAAANATKKGTVAPAASVSAGVGRPTAALPAMPKYQYYQSDKVMTISILEAGVREEDLTVRFEAKHLVVILRKGGKSFTVIAGSLYSAIDVDKSKVVIKDEKVLVKLRKVEPYEWHELLGKADDAKSSGKRESASGTVAATADDDASKQTDESTGESSGSVADTTSDPDVSQKIPMAKDGKIPRPYASNRNWDAIEKDIEEEEKKEKPQGDEAMNKLFQQIYANAGEDTRRAMVKSFQTSGGTVLSTNWDEVSKKDYEKERTAPKGVEWKTWEGDKVPMEEDD